jgi:hypothetical protein
VPEPLADARGSESASRVFTRYPSRDREGVGRSACEVFFFGFPRKTCSK